MVKHGYKFIGQGTNGKFSTNYFGAKEADVVVKNGKGEIIGVDKTKADGTFALTVDGSKFYQLVVEYRGKKAEKTIPNAEANKTTRIDVGHFDTSDFPEIHP